MAEKLFMTALSPTMEQGVIAEWHKTEGDQIENGDVICEVETDKAVMEYEADFDAVLLKILVGKGEQAAVGDIIAWYGEAGETVPGGSGENAAVGAAAGADAGGAAELSQAAGTYSTGTGRRRLKSSPLARNMAADLGINLENLEGSGYFGRIIKRDIEKASGIVQARAGFEGKDAEIPSGGKEPVSGEAVTIPLSVLKPAGVMRRTIAERLSASKFTAPHYYLTVSADMSRLLEAMEKASGKYGKYSINSFLVKFAAVALKNHPKVNSSWEGDKIRTFNRADIAFAVALEEGLVTPVIHDCGGKGVGEIDDEFRKLADKAKNGQLLPEEYSGAAFTISNLGKFGIEEFTAIINPPGSAILAIGAIMKKAVVVEDDNGRERIEVRPMMKMTLSCDHRTIDGAAGAGFLSDLQKIIENPLEAVL